jgi:hypothetical protein
LAGQSVVVQGEQSSDDGIVSVAESAGAGAILLTWHSGALWRSAAAPGRGLRSPKIRGELPLAGEDA